ncbi:MAG: amidohydrolase [Candidatus Aminicenantes bacterium]|nr:amidohydrolase [Candidatus Aminicenantes bacterium]
MKTSLITRGQAFFFLLLAVGIWGFPGNSPFVLKGATVYPATGPKIENAVILIENGKIAAVGPGLKIPSGVQVFDVSGKVIIPGLIDIHSHLGFFDADINEFPQPIGPENRALDALYLDSPDWAEAVKGGVVTLVTGPGSGERIGGQSITIKTFGADLSKRIIKEAGEVKMAINARNLSHIQAIRSTLIKAREYMETWDRYDAGDKKEPPPKRDLGLEALVKVLKGEERVRCHAHFANDMLSFLKLKDEFGFGLTFEHSTEAFKIADEIAKRGVGCVSLPLVMRIPLNEDLMRGNAILGKAGVKIAFHTDHPVTQEKWLRLCALLSMRYGLPEEAALKAMTINPAELAMISHRVGSIEKGKDADLVVLDGPWQELASRVDWVYVDGVLAYDRAKDQPLP